jgi:hypothetical protein
LTESEIDVSALYKIVLATHQLLIIHHTWKSNFCGREMSYLAEADKERRRKEGREQGGER